MSKTWTAVDLQLGKLVINRDGSSINGGSLINIERRYVFLDDQGLVLDQIAGGRLVAQVPWADIPENIQNALIEIDTWTKNQALIQEDMNEPS